VRRHLAIAGIAGCLIAATAALAFAAVRPNTTYRGNTSQGQKASLRTDEDGTAIRAFTIRREFDCGTQTAEGTFRQSSGIMVIKPDRRFYGHARVKPSAGGEIARGQFTIRGRFGPRGGVAKGTYRERVRLKEGGRCDTGEIRYRVKARG
jgi:hypothetical protein